MGGFQQFHETWHEQLHHLIKQLKKAPIPPSNEEENKQLQPLVEKFMSHAMDYYLVKSATAQQDVLLLLAAPWATAFERSLHWISGWRPTTAFHVIHSKSTMFIESRIHNMLNGEIACLTGDLGDLSAHRFTALSHLQCQTVQDENALTNQLSIWQDVASDVMLSRYEEDMEEKMHDLGEIVQKPDELRMSTLRKVVQLLTPYQTVDFLISAVNLHSFIRAWGLSNDSRNDLIN